MRLPPGVLWLDRATVLCLILAAAVWLTGGWRGSILGVPWSVRDPVRPILVACLIALWRHARRPRPSLPERCFAPAGGAARRLAALARHRHVVAAARVLPWAVVVLLFLAAVAGFHDPAAGFTRFICFGSRYHARALPAVRAAAPFVETRSFGYDGQFYAQLAVEPLLLDRAIDRALDIPAYRSRRILSSWVAYVLGLGRPAWVLQAYALLNVLAWLLLAAILGRRLCAAGPRGFLVWAACLLQGGLLASVRTALIDGPSVLLLALAAGAVEADRHWRGAAWIGLAGLARETNLLAAAVALERPRRPYRRWAMRLAAASALVALPLALWLLYLWTLYPGRNKYGFSNFAPFLGAYRMEWRQTLEAIGIGGWWTPARFGLLGLFGLTVQAVFLLAWPRPREAWWRLGAPYAVLLGFLGPAVWRGDPGAAARVVLPMTFAFNLLLPRSPWLFWPLFLLGNLTLPHGLEILRVPFLSRWV